MRWYQKQFNIKEYILDSCRNNIPLKLQGLITMATSVRRNSDNGPTGSRQECDGVPTRDLTRVRRCFERVPTGSNKGAKGFPKGTDKDAKGFVTTAKYST